MIQIANAEQNFEYITNNKHTSFTRKATVSVNTGASSLISVTRTLTVAVDDFPPTSVALISY